MSLPAAGSGTGNGGFVPLIPLADCPRDRGVCVRRGDHELAVFRIGPGDDVHVIDNTCPHAGGDLSEGYLDAGFVYCPWHHWGFSLRSGVSMHSGDARVRTYPCEVRDGQVYVRL